MYGDPSSAVGSPPSHMFSEHIKRTRNCCETQDAKTRVNKTREQFAHHRSMSDDAVPNGLGPTLAKLKMTYSEFIICAGFWFAMLIVSSFISINDILSTCATRMESPTLGTSVSRLLHVPVLPTWQVFRLFRLSSRVSPW
jgi:hypothetical protein